MSDDPLLSEISSSLMLTRPLVGLDTETTGVFPKVDKIIQLGVIKLLPDGSFKEWKSLVDPECAIPPESTKIHGITDEMIRSCNQCGVHPAEHDKIQKDHLFVPVPRFRNLHGYLYAGLRDCDVCGYNAPFDMQMIAEECRRLPALVPEWGDIVDVNDIYKKFWRRNLRACVEDTLGTEAAKAFDSEGAHDALVDTRWTMRSLTGLLRKLPEDQLPRSVRKIHEMMYETVAEGNVTPCGKLVLKNGEVCLGFTGQAGTRVKDLDDGMVRWILRQDFVSDRVKKIVREIRG